MGMIISAKSWKNGLIRRANGLQAGVAQSDVVMFFDLVLRLLPHKTQKERDIVVADGRGVDYLHEKRRRSTDQSTTQKQAQVIVTSCYLQQRSCNSLGHAASQQKHKFLNNVHRQSGILTLEKLEGVSSIGFGYVHCCWPRGAAAASNLKEGMLRRR
jgi:hypothetical protein